MLIAVMGMFAMSACGDDDDDVKPGNLPAGVENAMKVQFPNAQNVKWEKKGAYVVADFIDARLEKEAWFTNDVEKVGQRDMDLYYSPDGVLIKAVPDSDVEITPDTVI